MLVHGLHECLWQGFFSDPTQWWDNRWNEDTPRQPDFRHNEVWLSNWQVESQLAINAGTKRPPEPVSTSVRGAFGRLEAHQVEFEVGRCRKLCKDGQVTDAVNALHLLVQQGRHIPNNLFYQVLKRCIAQKDLLLGRRIHALTVKSGYEGNPFVATHLIGLYASHGRLGEAMQVFAKVSTPDAYNWATIIFAYARNGDPAQAVRLYRQMRESGVKPDNHIFLAVLKACAAAGNLAVGKDVHAHVLASAGKPDIFVQNSLVDMYAKCGSLEDAQAVFDKLPHKDVVTWTAMIGGYTQHGMGEKALTLYNSMQQEGISPPDSVTFVCLLQACSSVGEAALLQGKQLHAQIEERGLQDDVVVVASLVNMYAKCCKIEDARRVFDKLPHKNVVAWNAMIAGYAQQGMGQEAVSLYNSMQQAGTSPDSGTFVSVLQACATVAALPLGKQLHAQIEQQGLQVDVVVGTGLVDMYSRCGSMSAAQQVFDSLPERNIEAWSAVIAGYTRQGDSAAVFQLLDRMRLEGIQPNGITFLSVLAVCSHVGMVDKGREYFEAMSTDYCITPLYEHYICMMDLLGRAGYLDEALGLAKTMPFQPNGAVWRTLLGACRKWSNVEVGRQVFEFAVSFDDEDASVYVLMSNIYAGAQMWNEAEAMQASRVKSRVWKQPGQSWCTDMGGAVHTFVVGDK